MTRFVLLAVLLWPLIGAAEGPEACRAEVRLDPPDAFVGQQVIYRLRMLQRPEVVAMRSDQPLAFPSFRSEWLPGRRPDPEIGDIGEGYLVYEERRALFPARPGRLDIPEARLQCTTELDESRKMEPVVVPALVIEVAPLPEAGRPADFEPRVGPLRVDIALTPRKIALGEASRLSIRLRGEGDVWSAGEPLDVARALPGVDVFPHTPELEFDAGERLRAVRSFRYDLVPRRTGLLEIPALQIEYFDPLTRRYAQAETKPLSLSIEPARAAPAAETFAPPSAETSAAPPSAPGLRSLSAAAAVLVLVLVCAVGVWRWQRSRRSQRPVDPLRMAERAEAAGDVEGVRHALDLALREALARNIRDARERAPEGILEEATEASRELAELLVALERARFGTGQRSPTVANVRAALARK